MSDSDKVIKGLECCLEVTKCDVCPYSNGHGLWCGNNNELLEDALELLKAQEPRVMTLEEVKQHNNQDGCVWFEQPTYNADAAFVIQDEECTEIISPYILGEPINHGYWSNSDYNVTWRCWTSSPKKDQMEVIPWN